jgi:hypothetical protein
MVTIWTEGDVKYGMEGDNIFIAAETRLFGTGAGAQQGA